MPWQESEKRLYRLRTWVKDKTHYILKCGPYFILYEYGKKGIQGRYKSLEKAQEAAG